MKKQNMKKGITLIEIILAIVLIAIIMGITIPKLMSNSTKAEIKQTITSDVRSIVEAANTWRRASSTASGSFMVLSSGRIDSRLPSNMAVDPVKGYIYSSGLSTGNKDGSFDETGVRYTVSWQFDDALKGIDPDFTNTMNYSIAMDVTLGDTDLNWDSKMVQYAKDVFGDTIAEIGDSDIYETDFNMLKTDATAGDVTMYCTDKNDDQSHNGICIGNINTNEK